MNLYHYIAVFFATALLLGSCKEEKVYIPKPRLYPRVDYPNRNYISFDENYCNFTFEYPDYMKIEQDTKFVHLNTPHPCWFNLSIPSLNGDIHFTYTPLKSLYRDSLQQQLYKVYQDAYRLAEEHVSKSNGIEDILINNPDNEVYGVLFNLEGSVASSFQIALTDSTEHALRAALYFKSRPNFDSMAPVIDFVKADVVGILNSFKWKK